MKKIFSAILLMAAMALSVSTFVSCNDLVDEMESVTATAGENTEAIAKLNKDLSDLQGKLANAETALKAAQAAADAAQAAADAAQDDADKAQAAADAAAKVAAAAATKDQLQEAVNALNDLKKAYEAKVKELDIALAGKVDKATYDAAIKKLTDDLATAQNTLLAAIGLKVDQSVYDAKVAELAGIIGGINEQISALETFQATATPDINKNKEDIAQLIKDLNKAKEDIWAALNDEETGLEALKELIDGNVTEITGLKTALTTLTDRVAANETAIANLKTDVANLKEEIGNILADLVVMYNDVIKDLADRIQSVTFVPERVKWQETVDDAWTDYYPMPEVDNNILSAIYSLGETESPVLIKATYQVSPKSAVELIKDEDLYFSTVALKGEEAVEFGAKIIERNPATGRFVVVGYPDLETTLSLKEGTNVAVALNIASESSNTLDGDVIVDAGSYVSSSYNLIEGIYDVDIKSNFWFKTMAEVDTEAGIEPYTDEDAVLAPVYVKEYEKSFRVPYTTSVDASVRNLFEIEDVVIWWEGYYLSFAEFTEITGLELDLAIESKTVYTPAGDAAKSPIAVSCLEGTELEATAKLKENIDAKAVGEVATTTLGAFLVNDVDVNLEAVAGYEVVYKVSEEPIVIQSYNVDWSFLYGESYYYSEWNPNEMLERAIVSAPAGVDLRKLETAAGWLVSNNGSNYFPLTATVGDEKVSAYAFVEGVSSNDVNFSNIYVHKFYTEEVVYKADGVQYFDPTTQTLYNVEFELTVGAKPEDKTITLDPITMIGSTAYEFTYEGINPLELAIAEIAKVDSEATLDAFIEHATEELVGEAAVVTTEYIFQFVSELVKVNGKTKARAAHMEVALDLAGAAEGSYIYFTPATSYTDKYEITTTYNICGVNYTFVANVQLEKPAGFEDAITTNNILVDGENNITLRGFINANGAYELKDVKFFDYIYVSEEAQTMIDEGEFKLVFECAKIADKNPVKFVNGGVSDELTEWPYDPATDAIVNTWEYTETDKYEFVVKLTGANGYDVLCQVPIHATVEDLVEFVEPVLVPATYVNGQTYASENIIKGLKINDLKDDGKSLIKADAKSLYEMWTATPLYNQEIKIVDKDVKAYRESTPNVLLKKNVDYKVNSDKTSEDFGKVTFLYENDADLTDPIIVEVPVELTHIFCPAGTHTGTVKVKFTNAE